MGLTLSSVTAIVALQLSCGPTDRAFAAPESPLTVDADPLVLGPVAMDGLATATLTVHNSNRVAVALLLQLEGDGFSIDSDGTGSGSDSPEVPVDSSLELQLSYAPVSSEPVDGWLSLTEDLGVALVGLADPDADDDGDVHPDAGGGDCDDHDPDIGPSSPETWYDGVDQDCDGNDDDADFDGVSVDDDCDDHDDDRFPGNVESWYDGVDQDCDGNDADADLDGYDADALDAHGELIPGTDCDDGDASVNPGADDLPDGIDQDCDGLTDESGAGPGTALLVELFPENPYKTEGSDEYLELWLKDGRVLDGWELHSEKSGGSITQTAPAGTTWLLLCSAGLSDDQPDCGAVVEPWPNMDRQSDRLELTVGGVLVDGLSWDASWGVRDGSIQLDLDALTGAEADNDPRTAWCEVEPSPGAENQVCP